MRQAGRAEIAGRALVVLQGDLTAARVDVVVNAANERLAHGGGLAAALSRAGGPQVQDASDAWLAKHGPLGPGQAAVTTAGALPAGHLIHVVGPRYREGQDNEGLLRQAVVAALDAARDLDASTVALPAISAGIFGYPLQESTAVIAAAVRNWLSDSPGGVREVQLVGFDEATAGAFAAAL